MCSAPRAAIQCRRNSSVANLDARTRSVLESVASKAFNSVGEQSSVTRQTWTSPEMEIRRSVGDPSLPGACVLLTGLGAVLGSRAPCARPAARGTQRGDHGWLESWRPYVTAPRDSLFQELSSRHQSCPVCTIDAHGCDFRGQPLRPIHTAVHSAVPRCVETWSRLFGVIPGQGATPAHPNGVASASVAPCFRGILPHAMNGGHPCLGPLFDWYRFAREVWDWWWYPFDMDGTAASTTSDNCETAFSGPLCGQTLRCYSG
jgi:hypothetical protein